MGGILVKFHFKVLFKHRLVLVCFCMRQFVCSSIYFFIENESFFSKTLQGPSRHCLGGHKHSQKFHSCQCVYISVLWTHNSIQLCRQGCNLERQNFAVIEFLQVSFVKFPKQKTNLLILYSIFCCETHDNVNRIFFVFAEVTNDQKLINTTSLTGFLPLLFWKSYLCEGGCETFLWNNTLCVYRVLDIFRSSDSRWSCIK